MKAKSSSKILSIMLVGMLVLGLLPVSAFAEGTVLPAGKSNVIVAFESLPKENEIQKVPLGTALGDLNLPQTLTATVSLAAATDLTVPEQNEPAENTIPVQVKWISNPEYDGDTPGTYIFTAEVEGFQVHAPKPLAVVMVEPGSTGTARMALFGAGEPWDGSGTGADPYKISDRAGLEALAASIRSGNLYYEKWFILTRDIDLSGSDWTPIGNDSTPFMGSFDGDGFMVKNMSVKQSGSGYAGLFGYVIGDSNEIRNLGVSGSVEVTNSNNAVAGGIAGYSKAFISKCYSSCEISVSNVDWFYAGGISGYAASWNMTNCYNNGNINVTGVGTSGAVGAAGGIAGNFGENNAGNVYNIGYCYNVGQISATYENGVTAAVGGVVGRYNGPKINVTSTYYLVTSTPYNVDMRAVPNTKEYMQSLDFLNLLKQTGVLWKIESGRNGGYPFLSFRGPMFKITATAGPDGSISPSGVIDVEEGSDKEFVIRAQPDRTIASLVVDGLPVKEAVPSKTEFRYTFSDISADHTIEATFSSSSNPAADFTVAPIPPQKPTGSPITPEVTVTKGADTLVKGVDYTVSYGNNISPGVATATVIGKGNFMSSGAVPVNFLIAEETYRLTFDANGGSGSMPEQIFGKGLPQAIASNEFIYAGMDFTGWNTLKSGGNAYADRQEITLDADTTLYAQWETARNVTVTFDNNGGTTEANPRTKTLGRGLTIALPTPPTKSGEFFRGWNTEMDGSGIPFTASTTVTGDITVYAQWGAVFKVTFDKNGGDTEAAPNTRELSYGQTTALPTPPTKSGELFRGWNTAMDGSGAPFTASTAVTGDITVYAQWGGKFNVTFDKNGGDTAPDPPVQSVSYGGVTTPPGTLPTRQGYSFLGWNRAADGGGAEFTVSTPVTDDITVYAQWIKHLTVGSGTESEPYLIGTADELRSMAYFVNNDNGNYGNKHYRMTADIDLGARWTTDGDGNVTLNSGKAWTPIGVSEGRDQFSGIFDGGGHSVSGLYINTTAQCQGLFGSVEDAIIENVGISDAYIKSSYTYVGGVVGYVQYFDEPGRRIAIIRNCYNAGTVNGGQYAGGIVGFAAGRINIINCYNTGAVTSEDHGAGGVAGYVMVGGQMLNCYNTGAVTGKRGQAGGICGDTYSRIKGCYSTGPVKGTPPNKLWGVGALLGNAKSSSSLEECYFLEGTASAGIGLFIDGLAYLPGEVPDGFGSGIYEMTQVTDAELRSGKIAHLLQGRDPDLVWGHTTIDGSALPGLAAIDSQVKKVVRVRFYDDSAANPGSFALSSTAYTLSGGMAAFPALSGVTWRDGVNAVYDSGSTFSADTDLYAVPASASDVTFTAAQTGGAGGTADSTGIVLTFSQAVTNLTADKITIGDGTGSATKGTLSGSGTAWTIGLAAIDREGNVTVSVADFGSFHVTTAAQAVAVYKNTIPITVTSVTVKTAPARTTYTAGETLDLTGLVVTLNKSDSSTEDVALAAFGSKGITVSPANGTTLTTSHNKATISHTVSGKSVDQAITVNAAAVTDATISPTSVSYDLASPGNVSTNITWNSAAAVTDVAYGGTSLASLAGYAVSGNVLTIKNDYLGTKGFSAGDTAEFTISFDIGASTVLTVNIVDNYTPNSNADLSNLTVGGSTVSGFQASETAYSVELPYGTQPGSAAATVAAAPVDPKAGVSITQASSLPGSATVEITAEDGATKKTYTVSFTLKAPPPVQSSEKDVINVTVPTGAAISGISITATVANSVTSQAISLSVSTGASWKLYGDAGCISEIPDRTMVLSAGTNTAYVQVTAEDGSAKVYTLTITRQGNGGISSGGGGGGTIAPPSSNIITEKQPNMPTVAKMSIPGTVKDGILSATITEQMVKDAIKASQDEAKKSGREADGIALEFNITGSGGYTNLNVTIDAGAIDRLKEAGVKFIKIGSAVLDVTFDTDAVTEIDRQSAGTVTVSAKSMTKLSNEAKKLIGNRPVFNITVSYQNNGRTEYVSSFGRGTVTLGIAYKAADKEKTGNLFGVYVGKNGKPQLLTNSSYDNGRLIFTRNSLSVYGVGYMAPAPAFTDTAKHWAKDNIDFIASRDLISGTSAATFAPDTAITRADFLMALGRLSDTDVSSWKTGSFTDVKAADPAMPYIEWAVGSKIVSGYGNGKFGPTDLITREQMAVMMQNYAKATGYKLPVSAAAVTFSDSAKISSYAKAAIKAIQQAGIMQGKGNNIFDPQGNATRGEASTILRHFVELVIDKGTARGWVQNDAGQWQYISESGKPVTGWLTVNSDKYYFSGDGIMVSGQWLQIDGKWYYFYADGSLAKNARIDEYEVDENGVRKTK